MERKNFDWKTRWGFKFPVGPEIYRKDPGASPKAQEV